MPNKKQVIGKPLVINGRHLSLSRAIRAGDFVFLTGQIPFKVDARGVIMICPKCNGSGKLKFSYTQRYEIEYPCDYDGAVNSQHHYLNHRRRQWLNLY